MSSRARIAPAPYPTFATSGPIRERRGVWLSDAFGDRKKVREMIQTGVQAIGDKTMMRFVGSSVLAWASLVDNEREHAGSQAMAAAMVVH
ncbi:hypothetical protein MUK42_15522 [Musa troglodytarum]|uniref:Uncharacterized protein n=1 Tax=Musa troglodytarum TaxID=320322 RepID=A0A9E7H612_9LILI|nr:hypothetical protein MUK42_15522 [Musa troglodytarum]